MNLPGRMEHRTVSAAEINPRYVPPVWLEYLYYGQVYYAIMGSAVGISIPLLGVGMLVLLAAFCVMRMDVRTTTILRPAALPLACGMSFVAIQTLVLGQSLMGEYIGGFVPWMLELVIIQYLALRRGFLHRFAIALFLLGMLTLPYLKLDTFDETRVGLGGGIGIGNPNDLGAWFGFCSVYFTILALETRLDWLRAVSGVLALGCLYVVGLTVSRAPLLAAVVCIVFAFRKVLKRGFFPLFGLVVLGWTVYGLGVFERAASMYAQRGLEETGRFVVWPMAIERFLQFPLAGVGAPNLLLFLPISPHNSFIFIALASGVLPLAFFIAYWVRLFNDATRINADSHEDATFLTSLLLYSFLIAMELNQAFMVEWMVAVLCTVAGRGSLLKARRAVADRLRAGQAAMGPHLQTLAHRVR